MQMKHHVQLNKKGVVVRDSYCFIELTTMKMICKVLSILHLLTSLDRNGAAQ